MSYQPTPLDKFQSQVRGLDQEELKALIERRHPEYLSNVAEWHFLEATYDGGRAWFSGNIHRYIKEGDQEYIERVERAYRFNHTREVIDLVNKYIFKGAISRNDTDASTQVQQFWKTSTLNRRPVTDFMKLVSKGASTFGPIWVCVDSSQNDKNATLIAEKESGARVYGYTIKPQNVLDLAYDPDGSLAWVKVRETVRDDATVFATGVVTEQFRIWTKFFWAVFTVTTDATTNEPVFQLSSVGLHNLGRVPLFRVDHTPSDSLYTTTGLVDDTAYLDRAVANYLSNLDAIIQDQTFSQLVLPAQGLLPGDDSQTKILDMGIKRIFTFDASGGQAPQYISPDASQAEVLLSVINKIISEIYHSIGMAGERTKQDNAMGIDNSSGVAKAYDFDRMNAMLASKARSLELCENTLCELVDAWFGEDVVPGSYDLVTYPDNFDVRGLADEFDLAQRLLLIEAPDMVRQQQMETLVDKLFPNLAAALIAKMKSQIENSWPPEEVAPAQTPPTAQVTESRQGQNTSDSGKLTA